ncbi:MAG: hypothetical protein DMF81_00950 [Acidobacteria bacterium]|nr:MAG: hypothetical protein DMF81_00950 [Acidobacteriota bacterium]
MIGLLTVSSVIALSVWLSIRNPRALFYAGLALLPWQGLDFDLGLRVTASRIALGFALLTSLAGLAARRAPGQTFPIAGPLKALALYAVGLSLVRIPFLPDVDVGGGALRAPLMRTLMQCVYFLVVFGSGLFLAPLYVKTLADVRAAGRWFLGSLLVLAALGWLQLGVWYGTGWNPMPIGLLSGVDASVRREATIMAGDTQIHRMNSLGGEPKDLGIGLSVGLLLVQAIWGIGRDRATIRRLRQAWIVLLLSMLATLSTAAIFMWVVGTALELLMFPMLVQGLMGRSRRGRGLPGMTGAALFLAAVYFIVPKDLGQGLSLTDLVAGRTVERLELEDFDQAIGQFLIHEPGWLPLGVGLGNAHLYADRYLQASAWDYAGGRAFRSKMGLLKIVSELGLFGLLLWVAGVATQLHRLRTALGRLSPVAHADLMQVGAPLLLFAAALFSTYFLISGIEETVYLVLGVTAAVIVLSHRRAAGVLMLARRETAPPVSRVV